VSVVSLLLGGLGSFVAVFMSFGFVASLAVIEVRKKREYLFYYNNGISKIQLLVFSFLLNAAAAISGAVFLVLLKQVF
jgi:hypothetical protein